MSITPFLDDSYILFDHDLVKYLVLLHNNIESLLLQFLIHSQKFKCCQNLDGNNFCKTIAILLFFSYSISNGYNKRY